MAAARSTSGGEVSVEHAASSGDSGSQIPDLAAPPDRGEHHGDAQGHDDDRSSSITELMVSRLAGMPLDKSFYERYSSCSPGGMLPDNLLPVRFSLLSPFSLLRNDDSAGGGALEPVMDRRAVGGRWRQGQSRHFKKFLTSFDPKIIKYYLRCPIANYTIFVVSISRLTFLRCLPANYTFF
uniref:Uncharacterized protein n=1 Tax=Oryza glumipatula TaxID=40148 RepID=A0A0E0A8K8_9ORYZ